MSNQFKSVLEGARYKTFCVSYRFAGGEWSFEIKARDWAEAEARLKAIGWARIDGEIVATLPGWLPAWSVALICAVRNWRRGA